MAGKLRNKVALITGASQGQGAAVARLFAQEGAKVVLTDIADAAGRKVAAEIARGGGNACYYHLDVAQEAQWREVLRKMKKRHGGLHVFINNAGTVSRKKIETMSAARKEACIRGSALALPIKSRPRRRRCADRIPLRARRSRAARFRPRVPRFHQMREASPRRDRGV